MCPISQGPPYGKGRSLRDAAIIPPAKDFSVGTIENQRAIVAWEAAEGGHLFNTAHVNPLNTTQSAPGATSMNAVGVKAYVSWEQGTRATITTLYNGFYGGILAALRRDDDAQAVADAVAASPWGAGPFSVAALARFRHRPSGMRSAVAATRRERYARISPRTAPPASSAQPARGRCAGRPGPRGGRPWRSASVMRRRPTPP
jgi:hypothetical protein